MKTPKWILFGAAPLLLALLGILFAIGISIGRGVREASETAVAEHGVTPVDSLMRVADSPAHSLDERNRAVWALGQLGDARALPLLERYYTGQPCAHERALCQRELGKAIRLCRGSRNIAAFVWR